MNNTIDSTQLKVIEATTQSDWQKVDVLFSEYSEWCKSEFIRTAYLTADAPEMTSFNTDKLPGIFVPPSGFILLATYDNQPAGCAFLRGIDSTVCEMKRLYVNPNFRGKEVGKVLAFCMKK